MKIKVSSSYSGAIPVAEFSNVRPGFTAEVEWEISEPGSKDAMLAVLDETQKDLQAVCYANFKTVAEAARIEKIKNDMKGFRFYKCKECGEEHVSVTTSINPDYQSWVSEQQDAFNRSQGNICHARAAHFIATGEWIDPKLLPGVANDLVVCQGTFLDYWNFPALVEKYELKNLKNGFPVMNCQHKYAGTHDAECLFPLGGEKGAPEVPTIIDFKRTADRTKGFSNKHYTQMAAYAKCPALSHIQQMMIIETNTDTQQGFSKPLVSPLIDKYFEVFLHKRAEFKKNYGI